MFRIGDIANDKSSLKDTPETVSMLGALQSISRKYHDDVAGLGSIAGAHVIVPVEGAKPPTDAASGFAAAAAEEVRRNTNFWPGDVMAEFKARVAGIKGVIEAEEENIKKFYSVSSGGGGGGGMSVGTAMKEPASGSLVKAALGIYGSPWWNYIRFLAIIPEERPLDLVDYWQVDKNKFISKDEAKLRENGIKTGTIPYETIVKGVYLKELKYGYSCLTSMFPGGTVLRLEKLDGTPYDPAGLNPSGLITVRDASFDKRASSAIDIYVNADSATQYNKTIKDVKIYLVSTGYDISEQYTQARAKLI